MNVFAIHRVFSCNHQKLVEFLAAYKQYTTALFRTGSNKIKCRLIRHAYMRHCPRRFTVLYWIKNSEDKHMIALIVAYGRNRSIGLNGKMPWNIPGELKRFRRMTTGNAVIMGRRTFESIGKALPGRTNIVISSHGDYSREGCLNARSLEEAIDLAGDMDVYISGGAVVYAQALHLAEKLYITEIDAEFEADAFFPEFDESLYARQVDEAHGGDIPYTYVTYTRK